MVTEIYIRGNVPSKKNTQVVTAKKGLVVGATVIRWQRASQEDWLKNKTLFKELTKGICPIFLHLIFIRDSERLFDLIAPTETILDEMVRHGFISDDNYCEVVPCFGKPRIDKVNPGTIIKVLANPPIYTFL